MAHKPASALVMRRAAALAAAVVLLGGWIGADAGHSHAHRLESDAHHTPAHHVPGRGPVERAALDHPDAGALHGHADLTATAPATRNHEFATYAARQTAWEPPVDASTQRVDILVDAPPPRSRASPLQQLPRGPPAFS